MKNRTKKTIYKLDNYYSVYYCFAYNLNESYQKILNHINNTKSNDEPELADIDVKNHGIYDFLFFTNPKIYDFSNPNKSNYLYKLRLKPTILTLFTWPRYRFIVCSDINKVINDNNIVDQVEDIYKECHGRDVII